MGAQVAGGAPGARTPGASRLGAAPRPGVPLGESSEKNVMCHEYTNAVGY